DILGLEATFISEVDTYIELTDGVVKLTLLNRKKIIEYFGNQANFFFEQKNDGVALSFEVENVEEAYEYLKQKGVETVSPPWNFPDWGIKSALVRDPEGNLVELTQMGEMVGAE
ncbi:MAG TPA: VOC family protein, partial [Xenococcaceae cyanobacterium]